jgi:hypothetical protein
MALITCPAPLIECLLYNRKQKAKAESIIQVQVCLDLSPSAVSDHLMARALGEATSNLVRLAM